jgi:hypothetical protein
MPERAGQTQAVGEYCRRRLKWIMSNWNSENPPIIGVAAWIPGFLSSPAWPWSRQLGVPSVLGRNGVIQLRLGHIIVYVKCCSLPHFWADRARSSWSKTLVKICVMGRYFWICRCQNRVQGPRDRVYTVEKCLDRFCAGLGFVRVGPMPRPESDRDFSDPVVFGHGKLFQYRTRIGFGIRHGNRRSDRSVPKF